MPPTITPELYPWISAAVVAWGLLDCFFGYRVFKFTIALLGAAFGTVGGQQLGAVLQVSPGIHLGLLIGGGLVGAGVAFLLYMAAVFVTGFLFGLTLSVLVLANFNHMVALLAGIVIGILGGCIAVKMQEPLMKLSTSLVGAFRAIIALSYFTNQTDWVYHVQHPQQMPVLIDNSPWMFPAILVLAIVGVIAQFELGGAGNKKKPADE